MSSAGWAPARPAVSYPADASADETGVDLIARSRLWMDACVTAAATRNTAASPAQPAVPSGTVTAASTNGPITC